ncbi:T9SS type A sorting domain-containing protein [Lewinella sp. 4G2]|uniref:T9SS type A sorting domain-containing protein n=1 Tax=Lewinella sp. 4G2 TaxID=1803372 RepID=UPI0007B46D76|nr:T9SS type A sorting domain-containing protein [Lewinella sp. 4G2]OAV43132.1 hypothetical protein A3850_000865 [Lewinella sp. 4G2]
MKKLYFLLLCACCFAASLSAQRIEVPANLDPLAPTVPATNLSNFVDANPTNTVFVLERGGLYYFDSKKEWEFDVAFVAESAPTSLTDPMMPLIQRFNAGATNLAPMYEGTGNFTIDGCHVIMGEESPTAGNFENSSIRPRGIDKRYIFRNCWIEKSRQAIARIEGDGSKSYVENCFIQNMGDYQRFQGNGRLIDVRSTAADSVVIRNSVIGNILDRLYIGFRQRSNNYFEFSSNTVYNHVGRHGLIQLSNTREAVINNNLFSNPKMMGTTPSISDEQLGSKGVVTYLFTSDSIPEGGSIEMKNNNIFYTDDVLDYFNSTDTVDRCPVFGPNFLAVLGDSSEAYFTEVVDLGNVPGRERVLNYTKQAINDRSSTDLLDMMVEPISRSGSPFDNGYLFDFSTFDPCYSDDAASATAATDGGRVGARTACGAEPVSLRNPLNYNAALALKAYPNPMATEVTITYNLTETGPVSVMLYDATGKQVATLYTGTQLAGEQSITVDAMTNMPAGMYFANLFTPEGHMYTRIVKR